MGINERTTEGIEPIGPIIGVIATRTVATIGTRVIVAVIVNAAINPQLTRNEKGRSTSGLFLILDGLHAHAIRAAACSRV